eukprot:6764885-Pyramimonas_sp.AAC.1
MVSAVSGPPPARAARANARAARTASVGGRGSIPRARRSGGGGGRGSRSDVREGDLSDDRPAQGPPDVPWFMVEPPPPVVSEFEPA